MKVFFCFVVARGEQKMGCMRVFEVGGKKGVERESLSIQEKDSDSL